MVGRYRLIRDLNDALVYLWTAECGEQLWSLGKLHKQATCAITGKPIGNKKAWSPVTNRNNRSRRISTEGMDIVKRHSSNAKVERP
jgi:hypothetical protein